MFIVTDLVSLTYYVFSGQFFDFHVLMRTLSSEVREQQRRRAACAYAQSGQRLCYSLIGRERSGSMVECLTRDRGAAGSSLTGVTVLWHLSKTHLS